MHFIIHLNLLVVKYTYNIIGRLHFGPSEIDIITNSEINFAHSATPKSVQIMCSFKNNFVVTI